MQFEELCRIEATVRPYRQPGLVSRTSTVHTADSLRIAPPHEYSSRGTVTVYVLEYISATRTVLVLLECTSTCSSLISSVVPLHKKYSTCCTYLVPVLVRYRYLYGTFTVEIPVVCKLYISMYKYCTSTCLYTRTPVGYRYK